MLVNKVELFKDDKKSLTIDDNDGKNSVQFYHDSKEIIVRDNERNGVIVGWVNLARFDYAVIENEA